MAMCVYRVYELWRGHVLQWRSVRAGETTLCLQLSVWVQGHILWRYPVAIGSFIANADNEFIRYICEGVGWSRPGGRCRWMGVLLFHSVVSSRLLDRMSRPMHKYWCVLVSGQICLDHCFEFGCMGLLWQRNIQEVVFYFVHKDKLVL